MISHSYSLIRKTMIYFHFGPFWHFSIYTVGLYLYFMNKILVGFKFSVSLICYFVITSHIQATSQELLQDSIGMSRSNYFRHKPGLYNKNYSPQPLLAPSLDSDRRESAGYSSHRQPPPTKKLPLGLQLIMAVIRFVCQAVRHCVLRLRDSLLS